MELGFLGGNGVGGEFFPEGEDLSVVFVDLGYFLLDLVDLEGELI
jgi:hypothetical protein